MTDTAGIPVAGATVYLVPADDVDDGPITGSDVLTGAAEDRDEPLEDAVRQHGASYPRNVTGADGQTLVDPVPSGHYFWFVLPGPGDAEHLPGGSGCRHARDTSMFLGTTVPVTVSSQPGPSATYLGSSTCLGCHGTLATMSSHAHRLAVTVPGQLGALQDLSRYPDFTLGWNRFLPAANYLGGTHVYFTDFDPGRDADKFKTSLTLPAGQTLYVTGWLWRDTGDGKYKITLQNNINPADPGSPRTMVVALDFGGALGSQRYLVSVPGRKGLYPILQFQTLGNDSRYDRTRKVYRDNHLDWFWDNGLQRLQDPPTTATWNGNCAGCHATGFSRFQDPVTQEWLFDAVDDPAGEYDVDADASNEEVNIGCETCHGPGSDHVAWAGDPGNAGHEARYVVAIDDLSPERSSLVCGRCHDRPQGNGPVQTEEPLNPQGRMPPPGVSRATYLAQYTSRKGPAASDTWPDDVHSRSNHQQYSDFVKSPMHRNDRILTTCYDCHDSHGSGPFAHHLIADPGNPNSTLCQTCHAVDILSHMLDMTGATHAGPSTSCAGCHLTKTGKMGAGIYGILLAAPTGGPADDGVTYFQNDASSHRFDVPRKDNSGVHGILPADAMPIPYTNGCGSPCHDASQLQNPMSLLLTGPSGWPPLPASHGPGGSSGTTKSKEK